MTKSVGFTGTQKEPTLQQVAWLMRELIQLVNEGYDEFHHGDCIGADAAAHKLAESLNMHIVIHPPLETSKRAYCGMLMSTDVMPNCEIRGVKPYLKRNDDIVNETEMILALPSRNEATRAGGTWQTVHHAEKMLRRIKICYPDGSVESR